MIKIVNNLVDFKGYASPPPQNPRKSKFWIFVGLFLVYGFRIINEELYHK